MQHPLTTKAGTNFASSGGQSVGIAHLQTNSYRVYFGGISQKESCKSYIPIFLAACTTKSIYIQHSYFMYCQDTATLKSKKFTIDRHRPTCWPSTSLDCNPINVSLGAHCLLSEVSTHGKLWQCYLHCCLVHPKLSEYVSMFSSLGEEKQ
jgi:hypothetical protein